MCRCGEAGRRDRLLVRRDGRVPARHGRAAPVHRDEPAHPGRAHRHRGDHRRRPRAGPDAHRERRDAGRPRPRRPGRHHGRGRGLAVPHHHRGPHQRLPSRHRPDLHLPLTRRAGRAPRRRHHVYGRRGQCPLRLVALQAHLPRPGPPDRRRPRTTRAGGVPREWRRHQHRVPPGPAGPPGLRGRRQRIGPRHHDVHRRPSRAAHGAAAGRGAREAARLPRRRHGQPPERHGAGERRPTHQAADPSISR